MPPNAVNIGDKEYQQLVDDSLLSIFNGAGAHLISACKRNNRCVSYP